MSAPKIHLHEGDLPDGLSLGAEIAVDCEMMGLSVVRDRLCLVQLRGRDTDVHMVKIAKGQTAAPNLQKLLEDPASIKIFHYGRIDIVYLQAWLGIACAPLFCTKIASKLVRTYTDRHGLKDVARDIVGAALDKQQTNTDWGAETLTPEQQDYAASDVLYLHAIMDQLTRVLHREGRFEIAQRCFDFLPTRAALDLLGWEDSDIFAHH